MGRVRDLWLDTGYYFGIGEGSGRASKAEASAGEVARDTLLHAVPVIAVVALLRAVLDVGNGLKGLLLSLTLIAVVAVAWALLLRLALPRRSSHAKSDRAP